MLLFAYESQRKKLKMFCTLEKSVPQHSLLVAVKCPETETHVLDVIVQVLETFCLRRKTTDGNEIPFEESQNYVFHYKAEAAGVSETKVIFWECEIICTAGDKKNSLSKANKTCLY